MDIPPDPRPSPDASRATADESALHALAERSLAAASASEADATDADIAVAIRRLLAAGDGRALRDLLDHAPSLVVHRHLWRLLAREARTAPAEADAGVGVHLFAIPLVIVVGPTSPDGQRTVLPGTLPDVDSLAALLREHGALRANQAFALGDSLVATQALDLDRWPELLRAASLRDRNEGLAPLALAPAPIRVEASEAAHLRFLVGSALAAPDADLTAARDTGRWGMPLARALIAQLSVPGISVVALPRPASSLAAAAATGKAAVREIAASLFVSNALREFRAGVGEPTAVLSAHVAADAPGGGELRLSLSSPFSPKDAQGFRCPLHPGEKVADVAQMLLDLLHDCRVMDVRVLHGVHADRDPVTGGPLLFKPETIPPTAHGILH